MKRIEDILKQVEDIMETNKMYWKEFFPCFVRFFLELCPVESILNRVEIYYWYNEEAADDCITFDWHIDPDIVEITFAVNECDYGYQWWIEYDKYKEGIYGDCVVDDSDVVDEEKYAQDLRNFYKYLQEYLELQPEETNKQ